jgi:nucleolar protein 14
VKSSKKSKYHLSEEDDDEFEGIDGLGRDDFEDEMLDGDDDETDST